MYKLMSKEIVPKNVEESILTMEERGTKLCKISWMTEYVEIQTSGKK